MPDKTLLRISRTHTFDDHVGAFILLITRNDLELPIFAVGSKKCEELEQVHNLILRDHVLHTGLYCRQRSVRLIIRCMPRTIFRSWHTNRTVSITFTFCSKVEHIRYKHLRDALLILVDVLCSVQPGNSCTDRSLQLTNYKRESIYEKYDIQTFSTLLLRIYPLIRNNILILIQLAINLRTKEVD